jgi:transposase
MKEAELLQAFEHLQEVSHQLQEELAEERRLKAEAVAQATQLQEVVGQLVERVKELEGRLAKDSHNSSKPPSSNGFKEPPVRKTKSLRGKSGKKSGGQPGHTGKTLLMVAEPDQRIVLQPKQCQRCQQDLAEAKSSRLERFQVFDLPKLALQVTEYQAYVKVCPCCQAETRAELPEGMIPASVQYGPQIKALAVYLATLQLLPVARVSHLLTDLFGSTFSQASVLAACQKSAQSVAPVVEQIKRALQNSRVLHNDETGFRVQKRRWWLHVACTQLCTLYLAHPKRGDEALKAMDILSGYQGTSVHDSLSMYLQYDCRHALCVAHYLRELTFVSEQFHQDWAETLKTLLRDIHAQVQQAREQGMNCLPEKSKQEYERRYQELVQTGLAANPPPTQRQGQRGAIKKSDTLTLLIRLQKHQDLILRFMHDFEVPFTNNQAEADLRMMKLRQKISGCFRTVEGSATFCALRSYLSTMQKQGVHLLTALASTCTASPLYPPLLEGK